MALTPDQTVHTVFSAHDLIAAIPPPPAARLRAPALLRATLLRPQVPPHTDAHTRTRWWQITLDLLREGGLLTARDAPRGQRRVAFWGALVYQTLWLIALIWFAFARFAGSPGAAAAQGTVVEVEFIDRVHTSADAGATPMPLDAVSAPARPAPAASTPPTTAAAPSVLPVNAPDSSPATTTAPAATVLPESPLQVTEVPEPDHDFTLYAPELPSLPPPPHAPGLPLQPADVPLLTPPHTLTAPVVAINPGSPSIPVTDVAIREVPLLSLSAPTLVDIQPPSATMPAAPSVPMAEVELHDIPLLQAPPQPLPLPLRETALPDKALEPTLELELRLLPAPLPHVTLRPPAASAPSPDTRPITVAHTARQVQEREIALRPNIVPAPSEPSTSASTAAADQTPAAAAVTATTASAAQTPTSTPGALLDDDWGNTAQTASASGLLDASGRPRLADGAAAGRLPPGTIVENYENIDRMGTWLKRAPTGYQASTFEQFWLPPENLLEEWVRRSIKTILIPIPGTGKSIQCTVAFLMLGGGCGIRDVNLLDIEATARKPPEVPFKPELHEDQSILAAPAPQPEGQ